jgi:hypothetical protein
MHPYGSWGSHRTNLAIIYTNAHAAVGVEQSAVSGSAPKLDQPVGGLLTDLEARGLFEATLVVRACEMGRTPFDSNLVNSALDFWSLDSEGTPGGISTAPPVPTASRSPSSSIVGIEARPGHRPGEEHDAEPGRVARDGRGRLDDRAQAVPMRGARPWDTGAR